MSLIYILRIHAWLCVCLCLCVCVCKIGLFKGPEVSEGLMVAGQAG